MALDLTDYSGNSNTLTNYNATEYLTLPFAASNKSAVAFDGNQYLYAGDSASLSITGSLTIELWVNFTGLPSLNAEMSLVNKKLDAGSQFSYHLGLWDVSGTPKLHGFYQPTAGWNEGNRKTVDWTPSTNTWYHVAVTMNMAVPEMRFYVNGSLQGSAQSTTSNSIYDGTARLDIGSDNGAMFYGRMDEVRVWNVARSVTEINDNKSLRLTSYTNVAAYYPFDNGVTANGSFLLNMV